MDRKMNNPSWCCEKIQELIEDYKYQIATLSERCYSLDTKIAVRNQLETVISNLENILYN